MPDMLAQIKIKLAGADAPEAMTNLIEGVIVETNLHLPSMFTIRLIDNDLEWIDSDQLAVGRKVEISIQPPEGTRATKLFVGEITALEPELTPATPMLQVRGYDHAHRLHRGRRRKVYVQVTDSDIASAVAGEAGLSSDVDSTSEVYEYVYQNNLTNWEFLQERARRIGFDCYVQEEKLYFKEPGGSRGTVELKWGDELTWFRPRLSSSAQVKEVAVRGWDPGTKEAIVGTASQSDVQPEIGQSEFGGTTAESAFGADAEMVIVDRPVHTEAEAEKMAQAIIDDLSGSYVQADGEADGNPDLRAGSTVDIQDVGTRFSGEYFVTRATHSYAPGERYVVRFSVTGRRSVSVGSLLAGRKNLPDARLPGVVTGMVTNVNDPDELGRVKVLFPWLADDAESDWARVAAPMAGPERGFFWLPEVNDEVLVAFEHNDINYPYVIGSLWNGQDKPPASASDAISSGGAIQQRVIKTRDGHLIILEDSPGEPAIKIIDKTGNNKILIESSENKITIQADGDIAIEAKKKVMIKGEQGVEIESGMALKLESQTDAELKSSANVKVEGTANVDVKANAQVNIKGSLVNLN